MFPPQRSTHPFRIIEHDAISIHSMTSLGRVGRILAGTVDVSNPSIDKEVSQTSGSSSVTNIPSASTSTVTKAAASATNETAPVPVNSKMVANSTATATAATTVDVTKQAESTNIPQNVVTLQGNKPEQPDESEQGRQLHRNASPTCAFCCVCLRKIVLSI